MRRPGIDRQASSCHSSPEDSTISGIDDGLRPVVELVHEQAALDADLGRGQPGTDGLVHRLHHVVDEPHQGAVDVLDGLAT